MTDSPWQNANAAELLPAPKAHTLQAPQIEGSTCVWCAQALTEDTQVPLGIRIRVSEGTVKRWRPNACLPCAGAQAARVYRLHMRTCARCSHRDYCPDSQALYTLALQDPQPE
jgi:hypothetical protein